MTSTTAVREEWPSEIYIEAWKTFRALSGENAIMAAQIVGQRAWPRRDEGLTICDVGCGDGKLTEQVIVHSTSQIVEVRLIDPDEDLLNEAVRVVQETGLVQRVDRTLATAEEVFPRCAEGTDAVLLVHVVYLMKNGGFRKILEACVPGTPLFVIMDAPESVFTQLWRETAPKYYQRSVRAHETIANLPRDTYNIEATYFSSLISDPRQLRPDLRTALLSMLCYTDPRRISDDGSLMPAIDAVLSRHEEGKAIRCDLVCYTITRRAERDSAQR
jgi:hypothetical protein